MNKKVKQFKMYLLFLDAAVAGGSKELVSECESLGHMGSAGSSSSSGSAGSAGSAG
jgi:hypothetical protein